VEKPQDLNLILGQAHFIKTVDDLHEALAGSVPGLRFGIAFCESSGPRLVRRSGNDPELIELALRNALPIGAGHSFIVFLEDGFPVNVLNECQDGARGLPYLLRDRQPRTGDRRCNRRRTWNPRCRRRRRALGRRDRVRRYRAQGSATADRLQAVAPGRAGRGRAGGGEAALEPV